MYCTNCGKELVNNEVYCPSCGKKQTEEEKVVVYEGDKKRDWAFYIALLTSPLLYIIRMMEQTTEHVDAGVGGAWRGYDKVAVPENIQAVMMVILVASTCLNIGLRTSSKTPDSGSKGKITILLLFVNILLGLAITFAEVSS